MNAGDLAAGPVEAVDEAELDWIIACTTLDVMDGTTGDLEALAHTGKSKPQRPDRLADDSKS
jgi:hypothetical protein